MFCNPQQSGYEIIQPQEVPDGNPPNIPQISPARNVPPPCSILRRRGPGEVRSKKFGTGNFWIAIVGLGATLTFAEGVGWEDVEGAPKKSYG